MADVVAEVSDLLVVAYLGDTNRGRALKEFEKESTATAEVSVESLKIKQFSVLKVETYSHISGIL